MQPVQPAQRLERPPQPVSPKFNIDSPDDDDDDASDATTESSYMRSEQFQALPWPSPSPPHSGRNSPIPLPRGMSPASSQQPTQTPESSLTAWSGAYVQHGFGFDNVNTSSPGGAAIAGGHVNGSWGLGSRDMATFNLLRANSGRAASREAGLGGNTVNTGSGRLRHGAHPPLTTITTTPNASPQGEATAAGNAELTVANIAFLRRVPSNGSSRRPPRAAGQLNSGRPPKAHHTSNSPPHAAGMAAPAAAGSTNKDNRNSNDNNNSKNTNNNNNNNTDSSDTAGAAGQRGGNGTTGLPPAAAVAAFNKRWTNDRRATRQQQAQQQHPQEPQIVSPIRMGGERADGDRLSNNVGSDAHQQQHSNNGKNANNTTSSTAAESAAVRAGHGTAPRHGAPTDSANTDDSPNTIELRRSLRAAGVEPLSPIPLLAAAASATGDTTSTTVVPVPPAFPANTSPSAGSREERAMSEGTSSSCSRPRRTLSRHQAQVLPAEVSAADLPLHAAPHPLTGGGGEAAAAAPSLGRVPSPTAAGSGVAGVAPASTAAAVVAAANARRRANTAGRKPTETTSPTTTTTTDGKGTSNSTGVPVAATTTSTAAAGTTGGKGSGAGPVPAKRASTAATKAVPGAPTQYTSGGRLVKAAIRMAVTSPVDAPLTRNPGSHPSPAPLVSTAAAKASERKSPLTRDLPKTKLEEAKCPVPPPPPPATNAKAAEATQDVEAANLAEANTAKGAASKADPTQPDMESLASCSVHTIPPMKARELRQTQPPPPPPPAPVNAEGAATSTHRNESSEEAGKGSRGQSASRTRKSPLAAAAITPTPPQPPSLLCQAGNGTPFHLNETPPQRATGQRHSASPHDSEDSLTNGPPTPTRSRRSAGQPPRRSVTGSRSSNNTSREWNVNLSSDYPMSVASTQPPLSVRMPTGSQQWTQPTNGRSSSGEMSDNDAREASFTSSLSASANQSATVNPADPTNTTSTPTSATKRNGGGLARQRKPRAPQPPFSLDGVAAKSTKTTTSAAAAPATASDDAAASPILRGASRQGVGATSPAPPPPPPPANAASSAATATTAAPSTLNTGAAGAGTAAAASPALLLSPPTSTPPNTALRARRSSHAVNGSVERLSLTDRRVSAPAPAGRRSPTDSVNASPAATAALASTLNEGAATRRQSRPGVLTNGGAKVGRSAERSSKGETGLAPTTMVIGGRQLPRMFPSSDEGPSTGNRSITSSEKAPPLGPSGSSSTTSTKTNTTTAANDNTNATNVPNCSPSDSATDAEKRAAFLANRRRAHSLPAGSLGHGSESASTGNGPASSTNGYSSLNNNVGTANPTLKPGPASRRGFNVTSSTETERKTSRDHPQRPESHMQGEEKNAVPSRRTRQPSCNFQPSNSSKAAAGANALASGNANASSLDKDKAAVDGLVQLTPALASANRADNKESAFQPSPLRLPALTRFPRTPVTDTPPTPPRPHSNHASSSDDVRQESSGSGVAATVKDGHALTFQEGRRRRPTSRLPEDGAPIACDSHASSTDTNHHRSTDAAHSEGSVNGETPDPSVKTQPSHKKAPQLRQRAPSMHLF